METNVLWFLYLIFLSLFFLLTLIIVFVSKKIRESGHKIVPMIKIISGTMIFIIFAVIITLVLPGIFKVRGGSVVPYAVLAGYLLIRGYQIGILAVQEGIFHLKILNHGNSYTIKKYKEYRNEKKQKH